MDLKEYANMERVTIEKELLKKNIDELVCMIFAFTNEAWNEDKATLKRAGWGEIEFYLIFLYALFSYSSGLSLKIRDPLLEEARQINEQLKKRDLRGLDQVKKTITDGLSDLWSNRKAEIPWPEYLTTALLYTRYYTLAEYAISAEKEMSTDHLLEQISKNEEAQQLAQEEVGMALESFYRPIYTSKRYEEYTDAKLQEAFQGMLKRQEGILF